MRLILLFATIFIALVRETTQVPRPSTEHGCKYWSSLAYNLTHIHERVGDMMHMYCVNNNNSDHGGCQEMRCGGRLQQKLPIFMQDVVTMNFCFGFRLNHCDDPVSMSYYFNVPDRNVALNGKLTHNDTYEMPGGNFKGVDSTVFLTIEMTRKDPKHIEFGISAEVRAEFKQMVPLFDPSLVVFPPTLIDVVPCPANKTSQTTVPFNAPTACGLPANYTPVTPPPTSPPQPHGNGSATYHQPCELSIDGQCGDNEMCASVSDSGLARNGVCQCQPATLFVFYNPLTRKCEKMSVTSLPVTSASPTAGQPSVTEASTSKKQGLSVVVIAVIGVVGGLLLIVVVGSIVVYIGRRKRAAIYRDRHQLLTSDDDDVNMII